MGLVSAGGVHSSLSHLLSLCDVLKESQIPIKIHGFSDGRDCDPHSGKLYFKQLTDHIKDTNINLVSLIGRYYAMDRDQRWERIKKAYNLLIHAEEKHMTTVNLHFKINIVQALQMNLSHPFHFVNTGR